jgi:hypothetical protein
MLRGPGGVVYFVSTSPEKHEGILCFGKFNTVYRNYTYGFPLACENPLLSLFLCH